MTTEDTHFKVEKLRSEINIIKEEIKLKELECAVKGKELREIEWKKISWKDLEKWLKENRPENKYENNPMVKSVSNYHTSYCFINEKNELQIGPYHFNDHFPRNSDVYVAYNYRSYRQ